MLLSVSVQRSFDAQKKLPSGEGSRLFYVTRRFG